MPPKGSEPQGRTLSSDCVNKKKKGQWPPLPRDRRPTSSDSDSAKICPVTGALPGVVQPLSAGFRAGVQQKADDEVRNELLSKGSQLVPTLEAIIAVHEADIVYSPSTVTPKMWNRM